MITASNKLIFLKRGSVRAWLNKRRLHVGKDPDHILDTKKKKKKKKNPKILGNIPRWSSALYKCYLGFDLVLLHQT